jgi:hypothetical protein
VLVEPQMPPQAEINGGITIFPYPSLALDETAGARAGWIYCVYAGVDDFNDGVDIFCCRSTDNGWSWSAPVRINDDPRGFTRDQFHPWVVCDEHGILTAIWYDRRDDAGNYLWHIYLSRSIDGGATWEANVRVTDVPSSPGDAFAAREPASGPQLGSGPSVPLARSRAGLIGEYSGVAVRENIVHPVWTDTRNGHQDTYASVFYSPADVDAPVAWAGPRRLRAMPQPADGHVTLELAAPAPPGARLALFDATGRRVRLLGAAEAGPAGAQFLWDGRDAGGRRQPPGVYFVRRVGSDAAAEAARIVITR